MPRQENNYNMGYVPVPPEILGEIIARFEPQPGAIILDPTAGEGEALVQWVNALGGEGRACELDYTRARKCKALFPYTVNEDMFRLQMGKQRVSLAWNNPPYDNGKELEFLKRVINRDWVMMDGYNCYLVFEQHLTPALWGFLTACSSEIHLYGWDALQLGQWRYVCVVAKRGKPPTRDTESTPGAGRVKWIEALTNQAAARQWDDEHYTLPPPKAGAFEFCANRLRPAEMLEAVEREGAHLNSAYEIWAHHQGEAEHLPPLDEPRLPHLLTLVQAGALDNTPVETKEHGLVVIRSVRRLIQKVIETAEDRGDGKQKVEKQLRADLYLTTEAGKTLPLDSNKLVSQFLLDYKDQLITHLGKRYRPTANRLDPTWMPILDTLRVNGQYPLFDSQKEALTVAMQFKGRGFYFVCEPGYGKTTLAIGLATLKIAEGAWTPEDVLIVVCPGNMLLKWKREILGMRPFDRVLTVSLADSEGTKRDTLADVAKFCFTSSEHPRWLILDQDGVKFGEGADKGTWMETAAQGLMSPITGLKPNREFSAKELPVAEGKEYIGGGYRDVDAKLTAGWGERRKLYLSKLVGNGRVVMTNVERGEAEAERDNNFDSEGIQTDEGITRFKARPQSTIETNVTGEAILDPWIAAQGVRAGRNPRIPLWRWLKRFMDQKVAICFIDEIHHAAGKTTDVADSTMHISQCARFVVGLTGTLSRGVASSLYKLEAIIDPQRLFKRYPWGAAGLQAWIQDMGAVEEYMKKDDKDEDEVGAFTVVSREGTFIRELSRTTPLLVAWGLPHMVVRSLDDLGEVMPNYEEVPVPIALKDQAHRDFYDKLDDLTSPPIQKLRAYGYLTRGVNTPFYPMTIEALDKVEDEFGRVIARSRRAIGKVAKVETPILGKEKALIDTINKHLKLKQGICVYTLQSGDKRPYQDRLKGLIGKHCKGAKVAILNTDTSRIAREAWIDDQTAKGVNVLICNPVLVKEGLDLLGFQNYWWHELTLQMILTVQASHRGYRPSQLMDCTTYFPYYTGTIEERQMKLLGLKLKAHAVLSGNEISMSDDADGYDLKEVFSEMAVDLKATFADINKSYKTKTRKALVAVMSQVFDVETWNWADRKVTVKALSAHLGIQHESATGIINRLVKEGKLEAGQFGQFSRPKEVPVGRPASSKPSG